MRAGTAQADPQTGTALPRTLGLRDLVLLKIAAIINLSLIPAVAVYGGVTFALWVLAFVVFFLPSMAAVLLLARRNPGEGGIYLWTRHRFGDFHGFVCSWCYWTNNLFYIPMQLVFIAGVAAFASADPERLVKDKLFVSAVAYGWLILATLAHVRGLRLGKWIQNLGAASTACLGLLIVAAAAAAWSRGVAERLPPLSGSLDWGVLPVFGVICLAYVGVELASTMGDEIVHPRRNLPLAAAAAGLISLLSYLVVTLALFVLVPWRQLGAVQGLMQAVQQGAARSGLGWIVAPTAVATALAIGGSASAWLAGSSRIPFVAGIDRELPASLGKIHPRWGSPHVALITSAVLSALLVAFTLLGSTVFEAYQQLLKSTVVIQLIPILYLFACLIGLEGAGRAARVIGWVGLLATAFGTAVAFWPPPEAKDVALFETKMISGILATLGIGLGFFWRAHRPRWPREGGGVPFPPGAAGKGPGGFGKPGRGSARGCGGRSDRRFE
jgi:glutamate:GABA antiporter